MDVDKLAELAQSSHSMMGRRIVRSAMTPIVWLCLSAPCCFTAAYALREDVLLSRILGIGGVLPIIVACCMYVYFAFWKTDKLQSEDYQIRQELLQMVWKKGGKIHVEPISLEGVANPDAKQIPDHRESET